MNYTDHRDEAGYRACFFFNDTEKFETVADWLTKHGIAFEDDGTIVRDHVNEEDVYVPSEIMTDWITDLSKATLLKMTWGGA